MTPASSEPKDEHHYFYHYTTFAKWTVIAGRANRFNAFDDQSDLLIPVWEAAAQEVACDDLHLADCSRVDFYSKDGRKIGESQAVFGLMEPAPSKWFNPIKGRKPIHYLLQAIQEEYSATTLKITSNSFSETTLDKLVLIKARLENTDKLFIRDYGPALHSKPLRYAEACATFRPYKLGSSVPDGFEVPEILCLNPISLNRIEKVSIIRCRTCYLQSVAPP
jgi:hypothetical protein